MKDRPRKRKLRYCLECGDPEKTTSTCQVLQVSPPVQSTPQKDSDDSELYLLGFQSLVKVQREKQLELFKATFAKKPSFQTCRRQVKIHYSSC